jgi:Cu/Ag efflux protein CusF
LQFSSDDDQEVSMKAAMKANSTLRSAALALLLAWTLLTIAAGASIALAEEQKPSAAAAKSADVVEGEVIKIDPVTGRVTIRGADGSVHEFEAGKDTLDDPKVGERIEAKRRPAQ